MNSTQPKRFVSSPSVQIEMDELVGAKLPLTEIFLTIQQVAGVMNVCDQQVRDWIEQGLLSAISVNDKPFGVDKAGNKTEDRRQSLRVERFSLLAFIREGRAAQSNPDLPFAESVQTKVWRERIRPLIQPHLKLK